MYTDEKKINKLFLYWLTISLILVFMIIIVGGLTRLTNSGLSITEWELFIGILPPLNESSWQIYFDQYKQIPQYKLLNFNMSLNEFKIIFYWEYFHRIFARIIGIFFLVPLVYFHFSKKIHKNYIGVSYLIFALILIQGSVGWYMVKSGLTQNITVSHYRLALHLTLAFFIISSIFWLIINIKGNSFKKFFNFSKKTSPYLFLIFLIFSQIILGAFVSGLDAGRLYQTWPLMGYQYFPDDLVVNNLKIFYDFDNHSLIQFYHRNLAYLIIIYFLFLNFNIIKNKNKYLYKPLFFVNILLVLQVFLGILTLISGLNIFLASSHQVCSVILVLCTLNLYYYSIK